MKMLLSFLLCVFCANTCFAEEAVSNEQLLKEIRSLKEVVDSQQKKIDELEEKLEEKAVKPEIVSAGQVMGDELDKRIDQHLEKKYPGLEIMQGLEMGIGLTGVVQGTHNANSDSLSKDEDVADASYSIDLTFLKKFDDYGQGFVHLEQGNGQGVEPHLKVFSNVNRDADNDNNVRATEVWYEHYFSPKNIPLTVTAGKLDPTLYIDDNLYANDENSQFLGRMFRNSPVVEFMDNSGALRLGYELGEKIDFNAIALNGNADWENTFDGMFFAGQVNFKPKLLSREGNYRILGWYNDQNHTEWLDNTKDKKGSYGFGLSFDQELNDTVGLFARYGWQNPKVYLNSASDFSLEQAYSIGAQMKGNFWGRKDDVVGIAFGQIFPSNDYVEAGALLDPARKGDPENHLECYYNFKVNKHLYLSPDLQVIWNPYGNDAVNGDSTIAVGGMRAHVEF